MQENEITNLKISMKGIQKDISYIKQSQKEMGDKIDGFIKEAPNKFANKIVERIVYGMITLILVGVLSSLLYLVLK